MGEGVHVHTGSLGAPRSRCTRSSNIHSSGQSKNIKSKFNNSHSSYLQVKI